ncbi:MAM and LDL-receptor class A domain-containing protein 1-like [Amphiura filiformis]|uniref:MAM and LDL-receptor class A domain-containing protein 1-like n=1 Tax=Amphiura filiformis TaxID=82378 RepID=UPI003B21B44C
MTRETFDTTIGMKTDQAVCSAVYDFTCRNLNCISTELTCDGKDDCGDNSDENCRGSCGQYGFECNSGYPECIFFELECDGSPDCNDGSDEENC